MSCRVAILRPQPGADATAERARALGLECIVHPLFTVEPLAWLPPDPARFDALMLTSANAVRHAGPELRRYADLPLHVVGAATARAARERGLAPTHVGEQDAAALIETLRQEGHRAVLHLCGADVADASAAGLELSRIPVYRSVESGDGDKLAARLRPGDILLLHSPRAGQKLAALIAPEHRRDLSIIAISAQALAAAGADWAHGSAAPLPTDTAMLALALELCDKPGDDARHAARRE